MTYLRAAAVSPKDNNIVGRHCEYVILFLLANNLGRRKKEGKEQFDRLSDAVCHELIISSAPTPHRYRRRGVLYPRDLHIIIRPCTLGIGCGHNELYYSPRTSAVLPTHSILRILTALAPA